MSVYFFFLAMVKNISIKISILGLFFDFWRFYILSSNLRPLVKIWDFCLRACFKYFKRHKICGNGHQILILNFVPRAPSTFNPTYPVFKSNCNQQKLCCVKTIHNSNFEFVLSNNILTMDFSCKISALPVK